jgi:hypothetical protein
MLISFKQRISSGEYRMAKKKRSSLLESIPVLVLLGVLAGAIGGLGIGMIQLKAASSSAASAAGK